MPNKQYSSNNRQEIYNTNSAKLTPFIRLFLENNYFNYDPRNLILLI